MVWKVSVSREKGNQHRVWLEEGLKVLATEGPGALSIDNLTMRTGKTKGSFYHHYAGREQFIQRLLEYYEETATHDIILNANREDIPQARLKMLTSLSFRLSGDVELAIRAWALYEPLVRAFQDRIDGRRMEFLKDIYLDLGADEKTSWVLAYRNYALFIGLQQVKPRHNKREFKELLKRIFTDMNRELT